MVSILVTTTTNYFLSLNWFLFHDFLVVVIVPLSVIVPPIPNLDDFWFLVDIEGHRHILKYNMDLSYLMVNGGLM